MSYLDDYDEQEEFQDRDVFDQDDDEEIEEEETLHELETDERGLPVHRRRYEDEDVEEL